METIYSRKPAVTVAFQSAIYYFYSLCHNENNEWKNMEECLLKSIVIGMLKSKDDYIICGER